MTDLPPGLKSANQTLGWGHAALQEFKTDCAQFLDGKKNAMERVIDFDPQTGQDVLKIRAGTPFPESAARRATEAIQHCKHAIDQALTAACIEFGMNPKKTARFPWSGSAEGLNGTLAKTVVPEEIHPFLRHCKPYSTGGAGPPFEQDTIRELAKIANRKHTVNLSIRPIVQTMYIELSSGMISDHPPHALRWDAEKNEMEYARAVHGSVLRDDRRFAFEVILDEGWPANAAPAHELIAIFGQYAQNVFLGLCKITHNRTRS